MRSLGSSHSSAVFRLATLLLLGIFGASMARADFADLDNIHAMGIINGTPDTGSEPWAGSVVALHVGGALCTGTLVSPNVVVTAGHCEGSGTVSFGLTTKGQTQSRKIIN